MGLLNISRRSAAALGGIAAVTLVGSGLVAVATDTIQFNNNEVVSNEYVVEANMDLQVAEITEGELLADPGICDTVSSYSDGPFTATLNATIDLDTPSRFRAQPLDLHYFCVRNLGNADGQLSVTSTLLSSTDPVCSPGEIDAGDTSCGDPASTGELAEHSAVALGSDTRAGGCGSGLEFVRADGSTSVEFIPVTIGAGDACFVAVYHLVYSYDWVHNEEAWLTEAEWRVMQTDSFTTSVELTLTEITP